MGSKNKLLVSVGILLLVLVNAQGPNAGQQQPNPGQPQVNQQPQVKQMPPQGQQGQPQMQQMPRIIMKARCTETWMVVKHHFHATI